MNKTKKQNKTKTQNKTKKYRTTRKNRNTKKLIKYNKKGGNYNYNEIINAINTINIYLKSPQVKDPIYQDIESIDIQAQLQTLAMDITNYYQPSPYSSSVYSPYNSGGYELPSTYSSDPTYNEIRDGDYATGSVFKQQQQQQQQQTENPLYGISQPSPSTLNEPAVNSTNTKTSGINNTQTQSKPSESYV
jgi:hypothetical protein